MKRGKRILIGAGFVLLLLVSWAAAVTAKSDAQKQAELLSQAEAYTADEIYILAVPLLEEAAGYRTERTPEAEEALKEVYLHLIGQSGYANKYTGLLERQMAREDAPPAVFAEAGEYYLSRRRVPQALEILRTGVEKTGDEGLLRLYEANRYQFTMGTNYYQEVTTASAGAIQVKEGGLWGLASAGGNLLIPCQYDKVGTYSGGRVLVEKDGVISAVDRNNNRVALFHGDASDFGSLAENRASLLTEKGWVLIDGSFTQGNQFYEEIGMFAGGCAPAKQGGKWGLIDPSGGKWVTEPQYDDILRDELGRCMAQSALFVRQGQQVFLLVDGERTAGPFEDARPFADGYAAVKQGGKWGFIDTGGAVKIDCQFDDALSFGQHLAAVRLGELWGYVSRYGEVVIEPQFLAAKSFSGGSAPVLTRDGWRFITLIEYQNEGGLL